MNPHAARNMNMGSLVLEGGAEFGGRMSEPDLRALELAGGLDAPVRIIPAAAAPDQNHGRAGNNALHWFKSLGARDVEVSQVIDRPSAAGPAAAEALRNARLIYLLGGFPRYLGETLRNSPAWAGVLEAWEAGAVIAGSSAGAMVLCGHFYDPYEGKMLQGLGLLPNTCVLPHHNTSGQRWAASVGKMLPEAILIGIDEGTGIIHAGGSSTEEWTVLGAGQATLYLPDDAGRVKRSFSSGQTFRIYPKAR